MLRQRVGELVRLPRTMTGQDGCAVRALAARGQMEGIAISLHQLLITTTNDYSLTSCLQLAIKMERIAI